eukprot:TRINITY_DN601_c1_g1_i1.p1 TRINITY_DN601_c1_g1~~TRINITY_DN601_c1_g1_i1.p1  ORF type:complete len:325 (-),score=43.15 TRINITY_DN601_c1_g1_i1:1480-2454(-)
MNLLTFIESTLDEPEGPYHCWLNKIEERGKSFSRDGIFLVIVGGFLEDSIDHVVRLERVKLLQQRYPVLHVFGFQFSSSFNSVATQIHIVQTVMKEYIKFPILLSNKDFNKMKNGACYLLFQGFQSPMLYHDKDLDLERLVKVIEESNALQNVNAETVQNLKFTWLTVPEVTKDPFVDSTWARVPEVIKDPLACSSFRNLLLFFPGSISVDEDGDRLFISDTNHHRIIITDSNGKLLDCVLRMVNLNLLNYCVLLLLFMMLMRTACILLTRRTMQLGELIWKRGYWRQYTQFAILIKELVVYGAGFWTSWGEEEVLIQSLKNLL